MTTESPPATFSEREPEHGLPTSVFSSDSPLLPLSCARTAMYGEAFYLDSPRPTILKAVSFCRKPKVWRDVQCPCCEMSVQRNIPHLYLFAHLLCISGYKSMNSNAHRRVVDVVSEPATSKSEVTRVRLLLLKPFSSASLPCREQTSAPLLNHIL